MSGDVQNIKNPLYKALAIKIQDLSRQLGLEEEMSHVSLEILQSMNFDLIRIIDAQNGDNSGKRNKEALSKNFHKMDIIGTIRGTVIIFGIESQSAIQLLEELGEAYRIIYNLTDFISEIQEGLINIGKEDIENIEFLKKI